MGDAWRYTVEGEKLTVGEIIARVRGASPSLSAGTIRKRVSAGLRTWAQLGRDAITGVRERRDAIRKDISRIYRG